MAQPTPNMMTPQGRLGRRAGKPFFGLIDSVLVEEPAEFEFDGAVRRRHAAAAWTWIHRDLAPELIDPEADDTEPATLEALGALMPELLGRARAASTAASSNRDIAKRLTIQLGGEEEHQRLPLVLNALRCRSLLDKAQTFGRATNGMIDELTLATALQSMPWADPAVAALLMQATVGQVASPTRLVTAATRLAGEASELAIERAGYAPLLEALLAHAQNQIPLLANQNGPFADIDLTCRAIDRFHRLIRSINGYVELGRGSRWATIIAALVKTISARIEPRLRDVVINLNLAMRRHGGADRVDSDQILSALNGVYLLATVRDSRDSLALNALFDQMWMQMGQALEIHIQRNLDLLRANPADGSTAERLDAVIKMAELRFNAEYADVLRRAKETALR